MDLRAACSLKSSPEACILSPVLPQAACAVGEETLVFCRENIENDINDMKINEMQENPVDKNAR